VTVMAELNSAGFAKAWLTQKRGFGMLLTLGAALSLGAHSAFAQVVAQSTKDAGEIKLTATADGLAPATTTVNTQPCTLRPFVAVSV
jgi:hypothetical protein